MAREFGTVSCAKTRCGHSECAQAAYDYNREHGRRRRAGRPTTDLVDAEPVRTHVRRLMAAGVTVPMIISSGVPEGVLRNLLYAHGRRVRDANARTILSIPVPDGLVESAAKVDGAGSRRRVQALAALGHTVVWQADQIGMNRAAMRVLLHRDTGVSARFARRISDLYDRYWNVIPARTQAASVARTVAARNGWLPPLAWDDDLIDLPDNELNDELRRRAEAMSGTELARCYRAQLAGDRSPLIVAGADEYLARRKHGRRTGVAA
jgi:hypothetical protein